MEVALGLFMGVAFPGVGGGGVFLSVMVVVGSMVAGVFLLAWLLAGSSSMISMSLPGCVDVLVGTWVLVDFLGFFLFSLVFFGGVGDFLNLWAGLFSPFVSLTKSSKAAWSLFGRRRYLSKRDSISLDMVLKSVVILAEDLKESYYEKYGYLGVEVTWCGGHLKISDVREISS